MGSQALVYMSNLPQGLYTGVPGVNVPTVLGTSPPQTSPDMSEPVLTPWSNKYIKETCVFKFLPDPGGEGEPTTGWRRGAACQPGSPVGAQLPGR